MELVLRAFIVGGLATAAALIFEQALLHARMPTRYAWTFALLLTAVLPFVPRLSDRTTLDGRLVVSAPEILVVSAGNVESELPFDPLLVGWIVLSVLAMSAYARAYLRLRRMQRQWQAGRVANHDVLISEGFGPAVFGFTQPRIVIPKWVINASAEEQRLILLHEEQHIRAGDQRQLFLMMLATIATPWNPFVWLQSRRLGFRVETDCDQRVLAVVPDAHRYATLLLDVGAKQTGLLLTPALAEHGNGLERRLRTMGTKLIENRWKAAALAVVGVGLTIVACESRLPQDPPVMQEATSPELNERSLPRKQTGNPPEVVDVRELVARAYPPSLWERKIGGRVVVSATIRASGTVDDIKIAKSSGNQLLDEAALKIVHKMELLPRRVSSGQPQDVTNKIEIVFDPTQPIRPSLRAMIRGENEKTPPHRSQLQARVTPFTEKPELINRTDIGPLMDKLVPPSLKAAGIGGKALLWVQISEDGKVLQAKIIDSSGPKELDAAAIEVAKAMRFTPARNGGKPVVTAIQIPIVFKP